MIIFILSVQLVVLPLYMITWFAMRHERQQLLRQYKAAINRIQMRG